MNTGVRSFENVSIPPARPQRIIVKTIWVHGFLGNANHFASVPRTVARRCSHPSVEVDEAIYNYKTTGNCITAGTNFAEWLARQAQQWHDQAWDYQRNRPGKVFIILLGHSMGGLVCADAVHHLHHPASNTRLPNQVKIIGVIAYDSPFYGINLHVIKKMRKEPRRYFPEHQDRDTLTKVARILSDIFSFDHVEHTSDEVYAKLRSDPVGYFKFASGAFRKLKYRPRLEDLRCLGIPFRCFFNQLDAKRVRTFIHVPDNGFERCFNPVLRIDTESEIEAHQTMFERDTRVEIVSGTVELITTALEKQMDMDETDAESQSSLMASSPPPPPYPGGDLGHESNWSFRLKLRRSRQF